MKILFAGNSQTSCIKNAFDQHPEILVDHEVYFYVTPGGTGPYFTIKDNRLNVIKAAINPSFPPRKHPKDKDTPLLDYFDVIIVSALGYVDGGFYYHNKITTQGLLYEFSPKSNSFTNLYLSKPCYKQIITSSLLEQHGFRFLKQLRDHFDKKIIVQPFPMLSESLMSHPDWPLNKMYENPLEAHRFIQNTRDEVLSSICKETSAELLPYPNNEWQKKYFTPKEFIREVDSFHPRDNYGKMVLEQIKNII